MEICLNKLNNVKEINFILDYEKISVPVNCFKTLKMKTENNIIKKFDCDLINNGQILSEWNNDRNPIEKLHTANIDYIEVTFKDGSETSYEVKNYNNNPYDCVNYNKKSKIINYNQIKITIIDKKYLPITDVLKQLEYILEDIPVTDEEGEEYIVTTLNSDKVLCTKDLSPIALSLEILQKRFYIEEVNPFEIK